MSEHTPGPWHVGDEHGAEQLRPSIRILRDVTHVEGVRPTTYVIGSATYPTTVGNTVGAEERRANARLIAAAPDLLEALKELVADFEGRMADHENVEWHESWNKSVAAIAKATGQS